MSGACGCSLQKGARHQGLTDGVGAHLSSRSPGYSHSPLPPPHQAQPLNAAWPPAGLLQKGQCHSCLSENWRPEQVGLCRHHGWGWGGRGGRSVRSVLPSTAPSSLLCFPFSSIPSPLSSLLKGQTLKPASHPPSSPCAGPLLWCASDVEEPAGSLRQVQFSTANIPPASSAQL